MSENTVKIFYTVVRALYGLFASITFFFSIFLVIVSEYPHSAHNIFEHIIALSLISLPIAFILAIVLSLKNRLYLILPLINIATCILFTTIA